MWTTGLSKPTPHKSHLTSSRVFRLHGEHKGNNTEPVPRESGIDHLTQVRDLLTIQPVTLHQTMMILGLMLAAIGAVPWVKIQLADLPTGAGVEVGWTHRFPSRVFYSV